MINRSKVTGTVVRYLRTRGFGFIKPQEGGKEVFVHWEDLVTDDDWPFIERGTEVEYHLGDRDGKQAAKEVTLSGGDKIPVYTKPHEDREVNEEETFTGSVKFFEIYKGFGYVKPDEDITWDGVSSSGEGLYFNRNGIITSNAGQGKVLRVPTGMRVSFKVYKNAKGFGACEIQNENETPIQFQPRKKREDLKRKRPEKIKNKKPEKSKEELLEERVNDDDENTYRGTVRSYKPEKGFGFLDISQEIWFKDATVKQRIFVRKEDIVCYSDEVGMNEGSEVMFKIYKDSKGLGACEVMNIDGTPIHYAPGSSRKKKNAKRRKRN